jgi:predicted secreted protein
MNAPRRVALTAIAITATTMLVLSVPGSAADPSPSPSPGSPDVPIDPVVIEIPCADFGVAKDQATEAQVPLGASLVVRICSNPSTGYSWGEPTIGDETVLKLAATASEPAPSPMPGAPGIQIFAFDSVAAGKSTVDLSYDQPWNDGDKGAWTLHLDVVVSTAHRISIDCDAFGTEPKQVATIAISSEDDLLVTVCSNASTGFAWYVASAGDPAVLAVTGSSAAAPPSGPVGAPGTQTFRFHAVGAGSTKVDLSYDQPWDGGDKGAWTLELDVTVG